MFFTKIVLGIQTKIRLSSEFDLVDVQIEKLLGISKNCKEDVYLRDTSIKDYFDEKLAKPENIQVERIDSPFEHGVSILDLIFNEGINGTKFMKSFK